MTPRAILVWSTAMMVAIVTDANPFTRLFFLLVALNVMLALFPKNVGLRGPCKLMTWSAGIATAISLLFTHTGTHVLFTFPSWIPLAGGIHTLEGLVAGLVVGIGLAAGLASFMPLAYTLDATDLVNAIPRRLERVGAVLALSIGLLPRVRRSAVGIAEAQRMRGYQARRLRRLADVAVPVVLSAVEDSVVVAQAMEARAFGSGPRTSWGVRQWSPSAAVAAILATSGAALVVVSHAAGRARDWYAFPTLTAPGLEITGVVAALLCIVPAVLKKS